MSYTVEDLTSIDDGIFDTLWDASHPKIESGGTLPWTKYEAAYGRGLSDNEKKAVMKFHFTEITDLGVDGQKVYLWRKDGTPIRMTSARVLDDDPDYVQQYYTLLGPDAGGSRSWLYDVNYQLQFHLNYAENLGVIGYKSVIARNTPTWDAFKASPVSTYKTLTEEVSEDGLFCTFKATFL